MYGRLQEGVDAEEGLRTLRIMGAVDVRQSARHELLVEWVSSIANDMVADSIVALLLGIDSAPSSVKMTMHSHKHHHHHNADAKAEGSDEDMEGATEDEEALTPPQEDAGNFPHHPFSEAALLAGNEGKNQASTDETVRHDAYQLAKMEHMAAFLEAHFGQVEELTIPEEASGEDAEQADAKLATSTVADAPDASAAVEQNDNAEAANAERWQLSQTRTRRMQWMMQRRPPQTSQPLLSHRSRSHRSSTEPLALHCACSSTKQRPSSTSRTSSSSPRRHRSGRASSISALWRCVRSPRSRTPSVFRSR